MEERGLGSAFIAPFDVVLSDTDVVQPDLLFVSKERESVITEDNVQGAPDLVVEILSPSTERRDKTVKREIYARHGVKEYWLVDTDARSVTVLRLGDSDYGVAATFGPGERLASPTLIGLDLDMDEIFR